MSNYTPEYRETSGVGKRKLLTMDEVLRLPITKALVIVRGKKLLQVDKCDYSRHPEYPKLRSCKASEHTPEWSKQIESPAPEPMKEVKEAPMPQEKPEAADKPAVRKKTKSKIVAADKNSIFE